MRELITLDYERLEMRETHAAGHRFGEDMMCECETSWEEHQQNPTSCSINRGRRVAVCHRGHPRTTENGSYYRASPDGGLRWHCETCARDLKKDALFDADAALKKVCKRGHPRTPEFGRWERNKNGRDMNAWRCNACRKIVRWKNETKPEAMFKRDVTGRNNFKFDRGRNA